MPKALYQQVLRLYPCVNSWVLCALRPNLY